jgi:hypothetical protein
LLLGLVLVLVRGEVGGQLVVVELEGLELLARGPLLASLAVQALAQLLVGLEERSLADLEGVGETCDWPVFVDLWSDKRRLFNLIRSLHLSCLLLNLELL